MCYVCFLIKYSQKHNWKCWHTFNTLLAVCRKFCMVWSMPYWCIDCSVLLGSLLLINIVHAWGCFSPIVNLNRCLLRCGHINWHKTISGSLYWNSDCRCQWWCPDCISEGQAGQTQCDTDCSLTHQVAVIVSQLAALICTQEGSCPWSRDSWAESVAEFDIAFSLI